MRDEEIASRRRLTPRELLRQLGVPLWKLPRIAAHMRRRKREALDSIPLFPGAEAMLRMLAANGVTLALVTSDSEANARRQLGAAAGLFAHMACGASLFGKAAKFRQVMRQAGATPAETIAIGDELRDIEAARAAGIACGAVAWGYADPAPLVSARPDLMFTAIEQIAAELT